MNTNDTPRGTNPLVDVREVEKAYAPAGSAEPVPVLRRLSLVIEAGAFVALMGSSGSGKTTLLNLIGGLDVPDAGTIIVDGTELRRLDDRARSQFRLSRIGFVFQFFNLLPNLDVAENIALPLRFLGRGDRESLDRAAAMATEVGLGDKVRRPIHQLSGGEMQRVAIARALVHEPRLVLADEPTGNLDSKTGDRILELLCSLAPRHGASIIMATHDARAAANAGRVVRMADGALVDDATMAGAR